MGRFDLNSSGGCMKRTYYLLAALLGLIFVLTACGGTGELTISDPWSRPAMAGGNGAVYFVIENDSGIDDVLLFAEVNIAAAVEIHNVSMVAPNADGHDETHDAEDHAEHMADPEHEHDEDHDGMHENGEDMDEDMSEMMADDMIMEMARQENVPVANGETITFEPGSYHVMLIGLTQELKEGDTLTVTLYFENAGVITVEAAVEAK